MKLWQLTDLLTASVESGQTQLLPWWEGDDSSFRYGSYIMPPETVQEADACLAACGSDELLSKAGKIGFTLFHLLVWHNFYGAIKNMLDDGRLDNEQINLPDQKGHGITPFMLACNRGNLAMAKLLLAHGADDSLCDDRGMNAYHFLAYPRHELLRFSTSFLEYSASQRGEIARLLNCDINQVNKAGLTPLEQLLSTGSSSDYNWPLTEIFLKKGAKTDYVDKDGNTLLMMALRNGHYTGAFHLMEQCPELLDVANKKGITPAKNAISFRDQAMYLALTDHGAAPVTDEPVELFPLSQLTNNAFADIGRDGQDALCIALFMAQKMISQIDPDDDDEIGEITSILDYALEADEDASILDMCKNAGFDFTMPIEYHGEVFCLRDKCLEAVNKINVIRKLEELGVDMDTAIIKGKTPARILASQSKQSDITEESFFAQAASLFSKESMEQADQSGMAAIHFAAQNGHIGMLKAMIEKGVNINLAQDAPADAGATALHCACANGNADVVKLLIAAGADDTLKNLNGETPAHYAVLPVNESVELTPEQRAGLLKELKNIDLPREDGRTPLLLLKDFRTVGYEMAEELLPILIERGVDVNHADNNGMTALMLYTNKDSAKLLIQAGADVNMADRAGNTVLHHVLKNCNTANARYLIKKGADYNRQNNRGVTPALIAVEKGYDMVLQLMTDIK